MIVQLAKTGRYAKDRQLNHLLLSSSSSSPFAATFSVRGGATVLEPVGTLFALAKIPTSGSLMKFTITIGQLG